ncbi:MAG: hypothetical protein WA705_31050 [Candidatus Ozemobacteraceae bacterium]
MQISLKRERWIFPLLAVLCAFIGLGIGRHVGTPATRNVSSTRVENVLLAYIQHRKTSDQDELQKKLGDMHVSGEEFTKIIDRFLYYRMRQSSMNQAMKLLDAFRLGYRIEASGVYSKEDQANGFSLDAEVLTVFKHRPELVREAFGG